MPRKTPLLTEKVAENIVKGESTGCANWLIVVGVRETEEARMTPSCLA